MAFTRFRLAAVAFTAVLTAGSALAETATLSGDEIRDTVSGYTIEGSMTETGRYSEFYAENGTIRGEGYTGAWSVEGDAMCFKYGEDPADCWSVGLESGEIIWIKDGRALGSGTRREGNPNQY